MIDRIWYTLSMARKHSAVLRCYAQNSNLHCEHILDVDLHRARKQGTKIVVLDFDGVLAAYGETAIEKQAVDWLSMCLKIFPDDNSVFILSNKPNLARAHYFAAHFKKITFIFPKKKKPYPDGILQILALTGASPKELLMVDDRLLTGILAAVLADTSALLITKPMIAFRKRPVSECFYWVLRKIERFLFL